MSSNLGSPVIKVPTTDGRFLTHSSILIRAQADGQWVIHENADHPLLNIKSFTQVKKDLSLDPKEWGHFRIEFEEKNDAVIHVEAQMSNVAGYKGLTAGISGGVSGISSFIGPGHRPTDPESVTNRNWLIWYHVLGIMNN